MITLSNISEVKLNYMKSLGRYPTTITIRREDIIDAVSPTVSDKTLEDYKKSIDNGTATIFGLLCKIDNMIPKQTFYIS